jgi:hypothetical protein
VGITLFSFFFFSITAYEYHEIRNKFKKKKMHNVLLKG